MGGGGGGRGRREVTSEIFGGTLGDGTLGDGALVLSALAGSAGGMTTSSKILHRSVMAWNCLSLTWGKGELRWCLDRVSARWWAVWVISSAREEAGMAQLCGKNLMVLAMCSDRVAGM